MPAPKTRSLFVDTTILVYAMLGPQAIKRQIKECLSAYDEVWSGEVCRQEFKRRALEGVWYVLRELRVRGDVAELQSHLLRELRHDVRLEHIALSVVDSYFRRSQKSEVLRDSAHLERLLKDLLLDGISDLTSLHRVQFKDKIKCLASRIVPKQNGSEFDFGPECCDGFDMKCGVDGFVRSKKALARAISQTIANATRDIERTPEIEKMDEFAKKLPARQYVVQSLDPCLKFGDFLICLESDGIPDFYSANYRESIFLCQAARQNLILRREYPKFANLPLSITDSPTEWRLAINRQGRNPENV